MNESQINMALIPINAITFFYTLKQNME